MRKIFLIALLAISACSVDKRIAILEANHPEKFQLKNSDTILKPVITYQKYDSIITLPGSVMAYYDTITIPAKGDFQETFTGTKGSAQIIRRGKVTEIICNTQPYKDTIELLREKERQQEIINKSGLAIKEVPQPIPSWKEWLMWTGGFIWGFILLVILIVLGEKLLKANPITGGIVSVIKKFIK